MNHHCRIVLFGYTIQIFNSLRILRHAGGGHVDDLQGGAVPLGQLTAGTDKAAHT